MAHPHTFQFLHAGRVVGRLSVETAAVGTPAALPVWLRQAAAQTWPLLKPFSAPQKTAPQTARWQLGVRVVEAAEAQTANTQFRHKNYTPDVLSFPLWQTVAPNTVYAGDILICWPVLVQHAAAQGKPLKAHAQHLTVHALLHLAGYDHPTPAQAKTMEALEIKILKTLGWPNPYELPYKIVPR